MKFQCLHCGQRYEVEDRFAGRSTLCKSCGNVMKVPVPIGNTVVIQDEIVQISAHEMISAARRKKQHRWFRRAVIVLIAILIGAAAGAIGVIVIETRDPNLEAAIDQSVGVTEPAVSSTGQ